MSPLNTLLREKEPTLRVFVISGVCLLGAACTAMPEMSPEAPAQQVDRTAPPLTEGAPVGETDESQKVTRPSEATAPRQTITPSTVPEPATTTAQGRAAKPDAMPALRIAAVGDIMLGGSAAPELAKHGYAYPFVHARSIFQESDVVFGNLEGPLTNAGRPDPDKRYVFRSPPEKVAPVLATAGFNVVSLANNHTMDYGIEGLRQTLAALDATGIGHVGAGMNLGEARQPAFIFAHGQTVAFLAYSLTFPETFWARHDRPGTAFGHEHHIRADVTAARKRADIVVVSFHWGREVTTELRDYQPILAHAAIDAGALAVLGHHPHILQGVERYKHGIIFYSLGNFTFGSYSRNATRSMIAQLTIEDGRLTEVHLIPTNVNNIEIVFQPQPLYAHDANLVIEELQRLSQPLNTTIQNQNGIGVVELFRTGNRPLFSQAGGKGTAK